MNGFAITGSAWGVTPWHEPNRHASFMRRHAVTFELQRDGQISIYEGMRRIEEMEAYCDIPARLGQWAKWRQENGHE